MATRPFERPSGAGPEEPISSGSLGSQLRKYGGDSEMRLKPDQMWMRKLSRDLVQKFPEANFQVVLDFIKSLPEDQRAFIAQELMDTIETRPQGILRAPDQAQALEECLEEVKKKVKPAS